MTAKCFSKLNFDLPRLSMPEQGNQATAEVEPEGIHVDGKTYANKYHFLITIEDGRMTHVKEYIDTLHLAQLLTDQQAFKRL